MMELKDGRKQLKTRPCSKLPSMHELYYDNGGELPKELSGVYTSPHAAIKAAMVYASKKNRLKETETV